MPVDMARRRQYEGRLRQVAKRFGFREIATPIFENSELFTIKSGPNIVDEIYAFQDKGGREIALRPELTAPVIRMFVNELSNEPRPLKLFYFGQCFRYERPQSGRYREFFQFGAELIGNANPESDAEMVALAHSMIESLGLSDYCIRIGHIGVLRQSLREAGVRDDDLPTVLQKLDKKNYEESRPLLQACGVSEEDIQRIEVLTETVGGPEVLEHLQNEAGDYLRQMLVFLDALGVKDVSFDLGVVRGLDYYTGMVFEAEAPVLGAEKQICGGGSYSLSELFGGEKVFSTGFAIGFDRILLALEKEGKVCQIDRLDAYVVPVSDEVRPAAFRVLADLRNAGLDADIDLMRRKMGKALKHASSLGASMAVIVGSAELEQGAVTIRDMASGEQSLVSMDELVDFFHC